MNVVTLETAGKIAGRIWIPEDLFNRLVKKSTKGKGLIALTRFR